MDAQHDPQILSSARRFSEGAGLAHARHRLIHRFLGDFIRPHIGVMLVAVAAMTVYSASVTALPWLFETLIDEVFIARNETALSQLIVAIVILFTVRAGATFVQQYLLARVANIVSADVQSRFARHVLGLDLSFFEKNNLGQLVARGTEDVNTLNKSAIALVLIVGRDAVTMVGLVSYILWTNPAWFALALIGGPLIAVPTVLATRKIRQLARRGQELGGDLIGAFEEGFHAIRSLKAEGNEPVEERRLSQMVAIRRKVSIKIARTAALLVPTVDIVAAVALIAVLLVAGRGVMAGEVEPGALMAFVGALMLLADPLRRMLQINAQYQTFVAALERIYEVFDMRARIVDAPAAAPLDAPDGDITFDNVVFGYHVDEPVLKGLTLTARSGEMLAITGASGAGKTTLFNLIARLNEPVSGRITVGGQDVSALQLASLRGALTLVAQDALMFDATLAENIAYGLEGVTRNRLIDAARLACAHDFITALPGSYDFRAGPRGARLSGGQRQRIALARALLRNTPILMLDEATAALDGPTEMAVLRNIAGFRAGRTTLVIAHRLAVATIAESVVYLDAGRVLEQGSHEALLAQGGPYARAFRAGSSE